MIPLNIPLERDLIFFDIEATGLSVVRDRIVQIALIKYFKKEGKEPEEKMYLINPGMFISEEAYNVHGISSTDVANKPSFQQVAKDLFDFIGNADLAGYNSNRFDVPMLMEEFYRAGYEFDVTKRRLLDMQRIFYKMEPRTLRAALRFYTGESLVNAHDAMADVIATIKVFAGQLDKYETVDLIDSDENIIERPVKRDVKILHDFVNDLKTLDATQKLRLDDKGVAVFNFGKYNGKSVGETMLKDRQYYNWILNMEFSSQVKQLVKQITKEYEKNKS